MSRPFNPPGHAILVNLGIDAKNVMSFSIECRSASDLPTITMTQAILGTPEPTYALITREVTGAEPISFDIESAVLGARAARKQTIDRAYTRERFSILLDFKKAYERLFAQQGVPA